MATVTITSACNANISKTLAYEGNNTHLRDASFSSYLNSSEETFVLKLAESTGKPSTTITKPLETMYQVSSGRRKNEYGEISVFGAEKYFNGVMDEEKSRIMENGKTQQAQKDGMKPKLTPGTPSTCSEVSWNSRTAFLQTSRSKQYKANGKSFFSTFGCKCYCSDKKSVDVDENLADNKTCGEVHGKVIPIGIKQDPIDLIRIKQTTPQSWFKEEIPCKKLDNGDIGLHKKDSFAFPTSISGVRNLPLERQSEEVLAEKSRKSIEVFGSPILEKEDIALSLEKKLAMLTWDANPRVENTPLAPVVVKSGSNDDIDSDSSSDLFEIKSLSSNGHPFFRRQESDGMSGCMTPSSCYEPSEASIDWSVVTASAANFSVASDYDELKPTFAKKHDISKNTAKTTTTSAKTAMGKDVPKRRPSMLLGCRSHKAVKVAGGAHKMPEKNPNFRRHQRPDSFTPMSRFQAESKVTDFESAHAQRAFATGSLSQLHSARATDSIYMH